MEGSHNFTLFSIIFVKQMKQIRTLLKYFIFVVIDFILEGIILYVILFKKGGCPVLFL